MTSKFGVNHVEALFFGAFLESDLWNIYKDFFEGWKQVAGELAGRYNYSYKWKTLLYS